MEFKQNLKMYQDIVNNELEKYLRKEECPEKTLNNSMEYSLMAGGKRLRPILVLETYKLFKEDYEKVLGFSESQWDRISLLAYYGYGYGNHTDQKWYVITQVMIWRTTNPESDIYFTDKLNGSRVNKFDGEIAELESLVAKHYTAPKFQSDIVMPIGSTISLNDSNNVLSNYEVSIYENNEYKEFTTLKEKSVSISLPL